MRVRMIKMFANGVELERRLLNDRCTRVYRGTLVILDTTDQGRHRPVKVARITSPGGIDSELYDVHILWLNDNRLTLTGDERVKTEEGKVVCYRQSWLCALNEDPSTN